MAYEEHGSQSAITWMSTRTSPYAVAEAHPTWLMTIAVFDRLTSK